MDGSVIKHQSRMSREVCSCHSRLPYHHFLKDITYLSEINGMGGNGGDKGITWNFPCHSALRINNTIHLFSQHCVQMVAGQRVVSVCVWATHTHTQKPRKVSTFALFGSFLLYSLAWYWYPVDVYQWHTSCCLKSPVVHYLVCVCQ